MAQAQDHLDEPRDARGGLRVPQHRLAGGDHERSAPAYRAAVHGLEGAQLDGVSECGARVVRLHHLHVRGAEVRIAQRLPHGALLHPPVGRSERVGARGGGAALRASSRPMYAASAPAVG